MRCRYIQLSSGTKIPPLEEAERALRQALEDDDEYVPAILDLAWYYHAVEDDPAKALPLFERAYELSRQNLTEAIAGKVEALEELAFPGEAMEFFRKALRETVRLEDFDDEKKNRLRDDESKAHSPTLWQTSLTELLGIFRQALSVLVPIVEQAKISWREGEAYDDWDGIASSLFENIVVNSLEFAQEISFDLRMPKYDLLYPSTATLIS